MPRRSLGCRQPEATRTRERSSGGAGAATSALIPRTRRAGRSRSLGSGISPAAPGGTPGPLSRRRRTFPHGQRPIDRYQDGHAYRRCMAELPEILLRSPVVAPALEAVSRLGLPDWYVGAGAVAQTVWTDAH